MSYEFEVNGQPYRADKMPGRTQTHVFRRMAPVIGLLLQMAQQDDKSVVFVEISKAISGLEDDPVDYILDHSLETVERNQGAGIWAPVKPPGIARSMFRDIGMDDEMEIVGHIVYLNFWPILKKNLDRIKQGLPNSLSI